MCCVLHDQPSCADGILHMPQIADRAYVHVCLQKCMRIVYVSHVGRLDSQHVQEVDGLLCLPLT